MIGKLARVLYEQDHKHPVGWEYDYPKVQERYLKLVRIVLTALREPTREMVNAGTGLLFVDEMFTAMIDEALKG